MFLVAVVGARCEVVVGSVVEMYVFYRKGNGGGLKNVMDRKYEEKKLNFGLNVKLYLALFGSFVLQFYL